jgi:hypothetical protein
MSVLGSLLTRLNDAFWKSEGNTNTKGIGYKKGITGLGLESTIYQLQYNETKMKIGCGISASL